MSCALSAVGVSGLKEGRLRVKSDGTALQLAVDASSAQKGGGLTYLREMLPHLVGREDVELCALLVRESCLSEDWCDLAERIVPAKGRAAMLGSAWRRTVQRVADVVYAPTEIGFAPAPVPLVLALRNAVYDPLVRSEFPGAYKRHAAAMECIACLSRYRAAHYIAVSRFAADVGIKNLKVAASRISLVYHGDSGHAGHVVRDRGEVGSKPVKFLLVSNAPAPYKNIHRLIEALGGVCGEWSLDLAGSIEGSYKDWIENAALRHGIRHRVRFHGECERDQLDKLYRGAEWFVWPSYGETFGHPLLEAHGAGLKLLVARAASNPEIVGDAAHYFPPFDVREMRHVIQDAVDGVLAKTGGLPRSYAWSRCAKETAEVLHGCVQRVEGNRA